MPWLCKTVGRTVAYTKIPDFPMGPQGKEQDGKGFRFNPKKGYDFFLVHNGMHYAIENKMVKASGSFTWDKLDEYQEQKLIEAVAAGGYGWVLIRYKVAFAKAEAKKRGIDELDAVYGLPIHDFVLVRGESYRKSMPLREMEEWGTRCPRVELDDGTEGWDLSPLLEAG